MSHEDYMREALKLAREAAECGETPVGAVIVDESGAIIGRGRNRTEERDATCHAELEAIREAAKARGDFRLTGCTLYVTMEPCPMCAGGCMNSRVSRIVYGAKDARAGSLGSVINLYMERYGARAEITGGVCEEECKNLLSGFFKGIR